ncbi:hypothetical protein B7R54_06515 [Subtercola boreus]|uniref:Secreted protein n=1 Tax=Subtercola boreus TaxID=120213 RepID=A0A3E0VH12_9MICO|nr:hypothetical protein [Subtercola boreus]RFA08915.1 hypothetical protein B7R54_06515 [Subtercola boreus]TQL54100.1 hypothetical protein FB464_1630 [Subtercola boreus]
MTHRFRRLATAGLIAAATASLVFSGASMASAHPVHVPFPQPGPQAPEPAPTAPPVTTSPNQSFVVPSDYINPDEPLKIFGIVNLLWLPEDSSRSYGVSMTCDDGLVVPVSVSYDTQGLHGVWFGGAIPVSEQGKICTIHGTSPAGRSLVFGAPKLDDYLASTNSDVMTSALDFGAGVIPVSSTGGL